MWAPRSETLKCSSVLTHTTSFVGSEYGHLILGRSHWNAAKPFFLVLTNKQIKLDRVIQIYMSFKYEFHYIIIVDFVAHSIYNLLKYLAQ